MAISNNPTKTRTIENNWIREINKRWRAFKLSAVEQLKLANASANAGNSDPFRIIGNDANFVLSPALQRTFMVFLQSEIDRLLLGTPEAPNWQAVYQSQSYQRGLDTTRASLVSQGAGLIPTPTEVAASIDLPAFTATPSLGTGIASSAPIHRDALEFLFTRSYDSLEGWTDAMARQTRQILFDGIEQGQGIDEVVRNMVDRIDVSRSRARLIARTETIQAFQRSATNETERAGEELNIEILMRWLTVRDNKVRHQHAIWHGTLATPKENRGRISVSPWNCRCGQAPVIPAANTEKKRKKFAKERKLLLKMDLKGKK